MTCSPSYIIIEKAVAAKVLGADRVAELELEIVTLRAALDAAAREATSRDAAALVSAPSLLGPPPDEEEAVAVVVAPAAAAAPCKTGEFFLLHRRTFHAILLTII